MDILSVDLLKSIFNHLKHTKAVTNDFVWNLQNAPVELMAWAKKNPGLDNSQ